MDSAGGVVEALDLAELEKLAETLRREKIESVAVFFLNSYANPAWSAFDWSGAIPAEPVWATGTFSVDTMFWFDADIQFTRESWQGRIRACRGVGAALDAAATKRFDAEHGELLATIAAEQFTVKHRIDAHFFKPL